MSDFVYVYRYYDTIGSSISYTTNTVKAFPAGTLNVQAGSEAFIKGGQDELWVTGESRFDGPALFNSSVTFAGNVNFTGVVTDNAYSITFTNANYTVNANDQYVVINTSSVENNAIQVDLPNTTQRRRLTFIDGGGYASLNNITITVSGSDTIVGDKCLIINEDFNSVSIIADTTNNKWYVI